MALLPNQTGHITLNDLIKGYKKGIQEDKEVVKVKGLEFSTRYLYYLIEHLKNKNLNMGSVVRFTQPKE